MLSLNVRNVVKRTISRVLFSSATTSTKEAVKDPVQEASLKEKCFLVDEHDKIVGQASKKECHLVQENDYIPLHRAFSVFLFNKKGDLLLQKRSSHKLTYPDCYTNSCCSHPVANYEGEDEEEDAIGIKRAAQRRMNYELGIPKEQIPLEKLHYITRIWYKDTGNGKWGEHEIDYVLIFQDNVKIKPNSNEISAYSFVPREELDSYIPTLDGPLTPWFSII
ncbi:isopentenyl-diphosphate Delta-isomerase 1, partial [Agrilus planipennis]|uniref:isopentenyl-diphosphate Delta-isomerase n=1 Tax=Agrilus planipennis TaxID=224129 RepID=A0A1W4XFU4_AGRPL